MPYLPTKLLPLCTTINKDASKSQKSMTVWHDYLHRHHDHHHNNIMMIMMIHMYISKLRRNAYIFTLYTQQRYRDTDTCTRTERKENIKYASSFCLLPIFVHACENKMGWWGDEHVTFFCTILKKRVVWWYIFRKAIIVKTHSVFS